eukprot:7162537-Alexandrium_andersonii.AAC.1
MGRPQKKTTQRASTCRPSRVRRKRSPFESRDSPSAARTRARKACRALPGRAQRGADQVREAALQADGP